MAILSHRNYNKCVCMVANGQDGIGLNLKSSGRFFQVFVLVSQIKSVKTS